MNRMILFALGFIVLLGTLPSRSQSIPPNAPTNFQVIIDPNNSNHLLFAWTDNSNDETHFQVEKKWVNGGGDQLSNWRTMISGIPADATTADVFDFENGKHIYAVFSVREDFEFSQSQPSNQVTIHLGGGPN